MSNKDKSLKVGTNQNPIQELVTNTSKKLVTKYSAWNPYADKGISDEYYINEIIGIDELPYKEFVKSKKDNE
jgi:hypothetical protein|tara:strand:+ start:310 stop:525 length:216 start_codon:yes stop_codon:yes gene_type:complete